MEEGAQVLRDLPDQLFFNADQGKRQRILFCILTV